MNEQYDYFRNYLESFIPDPLIDGETEDDICDDSDYEEMKDAEWAAYDC